MAQTIKIKRSTGTSAPSSLANGELAYLQSAANKKLYIGRPGGGSGDIDQIGGKDTVDKADAALPKTGGFMTGDITGNGTVYGRAMGTDGTKLDGIEAGADVTDTTNVTSAGALMLTGGTVSGDIDLNNDKKITFGGGDLEIYHDNATTADRASYIKENGNGNLRIMGSNLSLQDSNGEFFLNGTENGIVQLYCNNIEILRTTDAGIRVFNSAGNKGSVRADLEGNADTATTATNVNLVADNGSTDSHRIIFANSQTGSQTLQTDTSLVYQPSTGNLSLGTGGTASMGNLTLNSGTINSVQTIKGTSTLTIDPSPDDTGEVGGSTTDTGTVVILGDLRVTGETFTVNSTTVSVGDNEIVLNGDHTGTPTLDAGLRVERGSLSDAFFNWDESEDAWVVGEGQSSSPYFYTLLHSNNFETAYSGNIEGGSF
jgi:hypothetical protein